MATEREAITCAVDATMSVAKDSSREPEYGRQIDQPKTK